MAAIANLVVTSRWHGHETSRASYLRALETGDETARKMLETMVLGLPHFEVTGTTDTNTADSDALNLSDQGVTFPDATQREILVKAHIADADGMGLLVYRFQVDGGSTPIVTAVQADSGINLDDSGLGGAPTLDFEVATGEVVLEAVGITDVDCRWHIKVWVGDAVPLAYIATT